MQLLAGLNGAQRAAVTSPASILQVLAPPGSGKTKTLTSRVAYLVAHHGHNPQNVICCTFTIKAAREMRERLKILVGDQLESKLVLGTIHSICRRYLVAYGHLIGIPKGFGIADTSDTNSILKRICKELKLSIEPKAARSRISGHKARGKTLQDLSKKTSKELREQEFITVFHEYEAALATSKMLDYDDLLLRCVDLLRAYPGCVSNVEALLIDEFQDTNIVQFELMKLLASANRRITIVGDPDQSIYGFRAAEIENLTRMKEYYPETVVINLEENYRSVSAILNLAQDVIEQDESRPAKKMRATHCHGTRPVLRRVPNPNEEALWIASELKRMVTMTGGLLVHSDFAILLRSAYLSLLIERALTSAAIPYRMVGGQRFFDRVEIRIIIDYLRVISHPDNNQAFISIINTPSRKIGETSIAEMARLGDEKKISLWSVAQKVIAGELKPTKKLSKPAEHELGKLVTLIKTGRQKMMNVTTSLATTVPSKLIDFVVKSLDFENYLKKKYKDDHEDRLENVQELITHASEILQTNTEAPLATIDGVEQQISNGGQEVLAQFLATIVLSTDVEKQEEGADKPRVTISTIHSAKGLEWPVVFIPAIHEGSIPHSRAENTDEERRLLYVAMTRAQAFLTMTFPVMQSRDQGESVLTQFLPSEVHHHLAPVGPVVDDRTIQELASVLRRPVPTQEDLLKSLNGMSADDSTQDDVWPSDGSRRLMAMYPCDNQAMPDFGRPLSAALAAAQQYRSYSTVSTTSAATRCPVDGAYKIATTMDTTNSWSATNLSTSFTTASHQLRHNPRETSKASSDDMPLTKRPKITGESRKAGGIAAFFSYPTSLKSESLKHKPCLQAAAGEMHVIEHQDVRNWDNGINARHGEVHNAQYPPHRHNVQAHYPSNQTDHIPPDLSSHKLSSQSGILYRKPVPLREANHNVDRNRYAGLYSSSPPHEEDETTPVGDNGIQVPLKISPAPGRSKPDGASINGLSRHSSIPANTMHTTTMSNFSATASISVNRNMPGQYPGSGRKTLGIRRTMNGWDNRKHK
jgi:DNA helicase II / ATP-dependent DNA helicase PcrA